jgi:rhodanese-related sulfurtransferase
MDTVTPRELEAMLSDQIDLVLVNVMGDVDSVPERIPSSHDLPASAEDFVARVEELAGSRHGTVVLYGTDEYSAESAAAASRLVAAGFTDVMYLEDGIEGWMDSGLAVESSDD